MKARYRRIGLAVAVLGLVAGAVGRAEAGLVVSLVGDKDGFGIPGAPNVPVDGTLWLNDLGGSFSGDYRDADDLANAPFTDRWNLSSSPSWTHAYSLGGATALSAVLDIQIAGIADNRGPWDVSVNSTVVGQIPTNTGPNNYQEILLYSLNIPVALLGGSDSIVIGITGGDGYAINFSELSITTAAATVVPEPSTLAAGLLGVALMGGARLRRRGRQAA